MAKPKMIDPCSCKPPGRKGNESCTVDAVVSVDERGQMVLPKELRQKAGINAGDKLAITSWEKDGQVCCIVLMKVENLVDMVKGHLGPIMKEVYNQESK